MDYITIIGLAAAVSTTVSFVPQAVKTIKTKHTRDLSLGMYAIFTFGILMWLVYGSLSGDVPLILANVVTLILSATILLLKIKHG